MSVNYNTPISGSSIEAGLTANPSISGGTIASINSLLNITPQSQVNVGNYNGSTTVAPTGTLSLMNVNITGTTPFVMPSAVLSQAPVWIFETNAPITATWGALPTATTEEDSGLPTLAATTGVDRVVSSGNGNDVLNFLDNGKTTVDGSAGNDSITTSGGADSITGGTGNDTIVAGSGNDTIVSGVGADSVDGGLGFDVVQVGGAANAWTEAVSGARVILTSTASASNTVNMGNVDFISFTGAAGSPQYSIVISGTANEATSMRLYQGIFDRSADQGGAQYWQQQVRDGFSTVAIANQFIASQEYVSTYGSQTNTQYVTQLYDNAFNRAPDATGLAYWVNALANGASKGGVAVAIVGSPEAVSSVDNVILVTGTI